MDVSTIVLVLIARANLQVMEWKCKERRQSIKLDLVTTPSHCVRYPKPKQSTLQKTQQESQSAAQVLKRGQCKPSKWSRTDCRTGSRNGRSGSSPKVTELDATTLGKEDVLRLHVSVEDTVGMQIIQGRH